MKTKLAFAALLIALAAPASATVKDGYAEAIGIVIAASELCPFQVVPPDVLALYKGQWSKLSDETKRQTSSVVQRRIKSFGESFCSDIWEAQKEGKVGRE